MEKIKVKISYWTYPEGDQFEKLDGFENDLENEYELEITSQKTDAMGGGLYELAIEIYNNVNFEDITKGLIEDGIKVGLGYFWKPLFKKVKELFRRNKKYKPDIDVARFIFRDIEIFLYPIFPNSIEKVIDNAIKTLSLHFPKIKQKTNVKPKSIHIPIFNRTDLYEVCAYRVKLNVDENISEFSEDDYFKLWGIRCESEDDFIYNVESGSVIKTRFYTQFEYDQLLEKKFRESFRK